MGPSTAFNPSRTPFGSRKSDGAPSGIELAPVKVLNEKTEHRSLIIRESADRQLLLYG